MALPFFARADGMLRTASSRFNSDQDAAASSCIRCPVKDEQPDQRTERLPKLSGRLEHELQLPVGKDPVAALRNGWRLEPLEGAAIEVTLAYRPAEHAAKDRIDLSPGRDFAAQPVENVLHVGPAEFGQRLVAKHRNGMPIERSFGILPRPRPALLRQRSTNRSAYALKPRSGTRRDRSCFTAATSIPCPTSISRRFASVLAVSGVHGEPWRPIV